MCKQFVISDENGNYVYYTDDLSEAEAIATAGEQELYDDDKEGSYAIGIRTQNGYTFDW